MALEPVEQLERSQGLLREARELLSPLRGADRTAAEDALEAMNAADTKLTAALQELHRRRRAGQPR